MKTIAFLACATTVPSSGERRGDAFEHDLTIEALEPALEAHNLALRVIDWEASFEAFEGVDLAILGTAWNYHESAVAFLAKIGALNASGITVCNPPDLVKWNLKKTYLRELDAAGIPTIPTLWRESLTVRGVREALDVFECDRVVIKRQIGAGAEGQELIARSSMPGPDWNFGQPAMVQPYLPAIAKEGELSFVFIDCDLSHALVKKAADGEYRIQSLYGGREEAITPELKDIAAASAVLEAVPFETPLYARIDMLRMGNGELALMEAEMIEPYLYPVQGPQLGERLAAALAKRL